MTESKVIVIHNESEYQKILKNNKKVVIFYTADYCPACKTVEPFFNRLSMRYHQKVAFVKADIQECGVTLPALPNFTFCYKQETGLEIEGDNWSNLKEGLKELLRTK